LNEGGKGFNSPVGRSPLQEGKRRIFSNPFNEVSFLEVLGRCERKRGGGGGEMEEREDGG